MTVLDIICLILGAAGLAFGLRCYVELYKWARQCQGARIAIARKGKVRLQAPLLEWLLWTNKLNDDEASSGRVIYRDGNTSVAILKPAKGPDVQMRMARVLLPVYRSLRGLRDRLPARGKVAA